MNADFSGSVEEGDSEFTLNPHGDKREAEQRFFAHFEKKLHIVENIKLPTVLAVVTNMKCEYQD